MKEENTYLIKMDVLFKIQELVWLLEALRLVYFEVKRPFQLCSISAEFVFCSFVVMIILFPWVGHNGSKQQRPLTTA